ncbi:ABC transporter ATP-binding protein [Intestinibacter sp.]|uniref:ABC transporter ATP-binding protein n=1 Tax=Intestinibacter sp. TaxID=1965304 RepID=UPI002A758071|nr:ABC transporter ATP-binding protein [Intestinibacter sp.]MDY2737601.1 ABC transporter ATP-binding protein [Intestinibacter sp.]
MSDKILEVKNLKKYYTVRSGLFNKNVNTLKAVDGVSFHVKKGETLGIVGESGCGKSTTGKMIVRLEDCDSGDIIFDGKDILEISKNEFRKMRPNIQLIFQNPFSCLNPKKKIRDILSEAIIEHNILEDKSNLDKYIEHILDECGLLKEHLDRYPTEFSGGQLQRIAIARAISLNPKLIIADEVVSALDVAVQEQILELFDKLKKDRKMGLIFISHDLAVIRKISDYIIVMQNGKIIEEGCYNTIFTEPKHEFTKELISSIVPFPY